MDVTRAGSLGIARLLIFVTVVEAGGFRPAAERLSLTQPAVSFHIRQLQALVGGPLFVAPRRGVELTEIGTEVYAYARGVVYGADSVLARIAEIHAGRAGRLAIAANPATAHYLVPELLSAFQAAYPNVEVTLRSGATGVICDQVERGEVALAIGIESAVPPHLATEPLFEDEVVLIVGPSHRLAAARVVTGSMLEDEQIVVPHPASGRSAHPIQVLRTLGIQTPRIVAEVEGISSRTALVAAGHVVALEFRVAVRHEVRAGRLRTVPLDMPPLRERFALISRPRTRLSPITERFRSFAHERMPELLSKVPERGEHS